MSEELKKTDIKKIAGRGCLIVAGILFLIFLCRYNQIMIRKGGHLPKLL